VSKAERQTYIIPVPRIYINPCLY